MSTALLISVESYEYFISMVQGFCKSPEGLKEYQKLNASYPTDLQDELYDKWISETNADPKLMSQYTHHKEKEVNSITRKRVGNKEYLVYSFIHYRLDPALNITHRSRSNIGTYPIPRGHYHIDQGQYGKQTRVLDYVESVETGYSIPFTKKNLEKILEGLNSEGKVGLGIDTGVIRISVATLEDFMNGDFAELAHFGKIPTAEQRRKWLEEEGGIKTDLEVQQDIARKKADIISGVQPRPVTADEVQNIIKQEQSKKGS
jgi:hypothetical protein